ncbi:MAG: flagellar assembly protein FliX [Holosporales bacterium]|jgi:hypothetical protein
MRITDNTPVAKPLASNGKPKNNGGTFSVGSDNTPASTPPSVSSTSLTPMGAILAMQEVGDALESKRRAVRRGNTMLDTLEALRRDLLMGGIPKDRLLNLEKMVKNQKEHCSDPLLLEVLGDIELRVKVELAKHLRD